MLHHVGRIALEEFGIDPSQEDGSITLKLTGTGDMAAVTPLRDCLTSVQVEITRLKLKEIVIDIRGLYLLNSSCLKALVAFLYDIQTHGPHCPIRFLVDHKLSWQARSLTPLKRLAPSLVTIAED